MSASPTTVHSSLTESKNIDTPTEDALGVLSNENNQLIQNNLENQHVITIEDAADTLHRIDLSYQNYRDRDLKIAGEFNAWIPDDGIETIQDDDTVHKIFFAPAGEYQYRLVIDGKWRNDPTNPDQVINPLGVHNSMLRVGNKYQHTANH